MIKIVLDDGTDQSEYLLQLWVLEADPPVEDDEEETPDDEDEIEKPEPEVEPIDPEYEDEVDPDDETDPGTEVKPLEPVKPKEPEVISDFDPNTLWALNQVKERV